MFQRLGNKLRDWSLRIMRGRYGTDRLNLLLLILAMVCSLLSNFFEALQFLSFLSSFLLIYSIFRMFSRNITARQREASAYNRAKLFFTDRQHRYYACPHCGQTVRVPRGKGKINIRCPRCATRFEKKT